MNVHVNQIIGGIYGLALMERFKYSNEEEVNRRFASNLPVLVMPSALQYSERYDRVLFLRNPRLAYRKYNEWVYPMVPEEKNGNIPAKDIELLSREMNVELFQSINFMNSGYHVLKMHLLIRKTLYQHLVSHVDIKRRGDKTFYRVRYDGTELSSEEMENEISVFEEAVLVFIANAMQSRYHNDGREVREYCFKQIQQLISNNKISPVWAEEMLKAISLPDRVQEMLARGDYTLNQFQSKICVNLSREVARFVTKAYEAAYAEI